MEGLVTKRHWRHVMKEYGIFVCLRFLSTRKPTFLEFMKGVSL